MSGQYSLLVFDESVELDDVRVVQGRDDLEFFVDHLPAVDLADLPLVDHLHRHSPPRLQVDGAVDFREGALSDDLRELYLLVDVWPRLPYPLDLGSFEYGDACRFFLHLVLRCRAARVQLFSRRRQSLVAAVVLLSIPQLTF